MYAVKVILAVILILFSVANSATDHLSAKFGRRFMTYLSGRTTGNVKRKPLPRSAEDAVIDAGNEYPMVNTTSGNVLGVTTDLAHAFYEVPYAEPPVGNLRFRDPVPLRPRISAINATHNGNIRCFQYCSGIANETCSFNEAEDCLVLNIFVPRLIEFGASVPGKELLPVMFYIHGGSFKFGSGTDEVLDGKELANLTNSIVVVPNYRLGVLGFLVHQEKGESDLTGNQGLKDQRLALHWVQDNIARFGGDGTRVMIFGNGAGAQSVLFHTISEQSSSLYFASIQQSNPNFFSFFYPDVNASLRITERLIQVLGCNSSLVTERECLLDADAGNVTNQIPLVEALTTSQEGKTLYLEETFMPVIDGVEYTDQPEILYREGKWNKDKPTIMGVLTQELEDAQFSFPKEGTFSETLFLGINIMAFGRDLGQVITNKYKEAYPLGEGEDFRIMYGKEMSHLYFDCPSRLMARYASNTTSSSVYFYVDSHPTIEETCVAFNEGNSTDCRLASHGAEVTYVFRNVERDGGYREEDGLIEDEFSTYWGSFARTGNPSNNLETPLTEAVNWQEYEADSWRYLHIRTPTSQMESGFNENICDFWDKINYGRDGFLPIQAEATTQGREIRTTGRAESTTVTIETTSQTIEPTTSHSSAFGNPLIQIAICLGLKLIWDKTLRK